MHTSTITIKVPNPFGAIKARRAARAAKAARIIEIDDHIAQLEARRTAEYARGGCDVRTDFLRIWNEKQHELALERIALVYG